MTATQTETKSRIHSVAACEMPAVSLPHLPEDIVDNSYPRFSRCFARSANSGQSPTATYGASCPVGLSIGYQLPSPQDTKWSSGSISQTFTSDRLTGAFEISPGHPGITWEPADQLSRSIPATHVYLMRIPVNAPDLPTYTFREWIRDNGHFIKVDLPCKIEIADDCLLIPGLDPLPLDSTKGLRVILPSGADATVDFESAHSNA